MAGMGIADLVESVESKSMAVWWWVWMTNTCRLTVWDQKCNLVHHSSLLVISVGSMGVPSQQTLANIELMIHNF